MKISVDDTPGEVEPAALNEESKPQAEEIESSAPQIPT
jgi:hypothetical protein